MSPYMQPQDDVMPIAVVGMSFRGPGDATNVENLLRTVAESRESRSKIPPQKWNHDAFYHPDPNRFGSVSPVRLDPRSTSAKLSCSTMSSMDTGSNKM
jgi:hypothetical protein